MPDITMCDGAGCSARSYCYRHRAVPDRLAQSWFAVAPGTDAATCEDFVPVLPKDELREVK